MNYTTLYLRVQNHNNKGRGKHIRENMTKTVS